MRAISVVNLMKKEDVKKICEDLLSNEERFFYCFFWNEDNGNAFNRKRKDGMDSRSYDFRFGGNHYFFGQLVRRTRERTFFMPCYYVNGVKKDSKVVRALLRRVSE